MTDGQMFTTKNGLKGKCKKIAISQLIDCTFIIIVFFTVLDWSRRTGGSF